MSGGGPSGLFGLPCPVAKQLEEFPAPQTFLYPVSHLLILHVDFSYEDSTQLKKIKYGTSNKIRHTKTQNRS